MILNQPETQSRHPTFQVLPNCQAGINAPACRMATQVSAEEDMASTVRETSSLLSVRIMDSSECSMSVCNMDNRKCNRQSAAWTTGNLCLPSTWTTGNITCLSATQRTGNTTCLSATQTTVNATNQSAEWKTGNTTCLLATRTTGHVICMSATWKK